MAGTQDPTTVSTKQLRIAEIARAHPAAALKTLSHHMDLDWMREAYRRTRKDGASGIDGQTATQYASNLDANLLSLLDRAKSGDRYRAPPVRRVYIPKANGEMRPLGIPTFEDKVLQRAVAMVVESVYEQDFLPCSYGFRPKRSPLQAVKALDKILVNMRSCTVLELDFRKFFDTVDHEKLREVLNERIVDGVIVRLIGKWLKAGVMEDGRHLRPDVGTPQGGVISPLLANIFLHTVLDLWFAKDVLPRMRGKAHMVRFADDAVMLFERAEDAQRAFTALVKRVERFKLKLHPEKTALVPFNRPWPEEDKRDRNKAGSFSFLGFTFYWNKTRGGFWMPKVKTSSTRLRRAVVAANVWMRQARHLKVKVQHARLKSKLLGHYQYFGVAGNVKSIQTFHWHITRLWRKWLSRRSQRRNMGVIDLILEHYPLPKPRIVHGYG